MDDILSVVLDKLDKFDYALSQFESFLTDFKLVVFIEEFQGEFVAFVRTFTYGELAIFILLFTWYLTYLLFKFWSVFK